MPLTGRVRRSTVPHRDPGAAPEEVQAGDEPGPAGLVLLYDIYGGLLTPKARRLFELRYHRDLSLAEIAAEEQVSRQAVHDVLQRSARTLVEAERRLGLASRYRRQRAIVEQALRQSRRLAACVRGERAASEEVVQAARAIRRALVALRREL